MIVRCALAVITDRGKNVIAPTLSTLNTEEEAFLAAHVARLRRQAQNPNSRGRFRGASTLQVDFDTALTGDDDAFLDVATSLVDRLAAAMRGVNSTSCVVAFLVDERMQERSVTLLKLDAAIDAARLETRPDGSLHLQVLQELLPSPGDLQKGLSWPDARSNSDLIVVDASQQGTAMYFQNAYLIDAAPPSIVAEKALVDELSELPRQDLTRAVAAIGSGGDADEVVERIRHDVPTFQAQAPVLGHGGALAGTIRRTFVRQTKKSFKADDIELHVPLDHLAQVTTRRVGTEYHTTIITNTPLTPPED
jgi:hypothetical protein